MSRARLALSIVAVACVALTGQTPVGTAFTYQGRLTYQGTAATGEYDLRFRLFTAATGGAQVGSTVTLENVAVTDGVFTVGLDFGAGAFSGDARWLEIAARPGASTGAFTALSPRQELTPAPHAVFAATARTAQTAQSVAAGAVTGVMIAPGAVGVAQVDTAQVQARISGSCPIGHYFRGIAADGGLVCEPVPGVPTISTVDGSAADVGRYSSIAIGADGLPVISYYDATAGNLRVAKCVNAACTGESTITVVDKSGNDVGKFASIALGVDGRPVVSYYDETEGSLMVVKCGTPACTTGNTITAVDHPASNVGPYTSIAIGNDGFPVISYYDATAFALKVAKCVNAECTGRSTITTVDDDPAYQLGWYTSIAIGTQGFPVIAYYDARSPGLKVARCANGACSGAAQIAMVERAEVGRYASIAIGADGLPVISYFDGSAGALKVAKCVNAACTGTSTIRVVDDPPNVVGMHTSIAIGADGLPVISYQDATEWALKVAKCTAAACTGLSTITTVDDPANLVGEYTSIAIGADGLPVISYYDATAGNLKVARCGTRSCQ